MKKIWAPVLAFVSLCLFSAESPAQDATAQQVTSMCVAEMGKQNLSGVNIPEYCSCLSGRMVRHDNKLQHMDGARVRQQVMNDLQPCFDKHMKPAISSLCESMNGKLKAEKQKLKVNCGCYYNSMLQNFSAAWAGNLTNAPLTQQQQEQMIQQTTAKCVKETP